MLYGPKRLQNNVHASTVNFHNFNIYINVIKADLVNLTETKKYITFVLVLLIWELIPTSVIIILFRVKQINSLVDYSTFRPSLNISAGKSVFIDSNRFENKLQDEQNNFEENQFSEQSDEDEDRVIYSLSKSNDNYGSLN